MRVAVLHAYSASNAGDGLLVRETLGVLGEAFPGPLEVTVLALHPETFGDLECEVISARPGFLGYGREYRRVLRGLGAFDLVVAVGGGYLRAGTVTEVVKSLAAHGPQLWAASKCAAPVVYLPQSVGPFRFGSRDFARALLGRMTVVHLRDDRSVAEAQLANAVRTPDLALLSRNKRERTGPLGSATPILSVRAVGGSVPKRVARLASMMGTFDGFVQSVGAGNDDTKSMLSMSPQRLVDRTELLGEDRSRRVVVAVRLHGALMALNAGHWVVHVAYERKGFGAFSDLGLDRFVHPIRSFDPNEVLQQVTSLLADPAARAAYDSLIAQSSAELEPRRARLVRSVRDAAVGTGPRR